MSHGNTAEPLANAWQIASEPITNGIGVQQEAGHRLFVLEQPALLGRATITVSKEVGGDIRGMGKGEEIVPRFGLAGEDDVAGFGIFADVDFARGESERGRQPDRLHILLETGGRVLAKAECSIQARGDARRAAQGRPFQFIRTTARARALRELAPALLTEPEWC